MLVLRSISISLCTLALAAVPLAAAPNFTVILGQPTDSSVTVNARSDTAVEMYFEYGLKSSTYTVQTKSADAAADPYASGFFVTQTPITGLQPNTQYYYRMQYRLVGSSGAFTPLAENTFHTQRPPGSTFVFCVQGDSHPERAKTMFNANLYIQTLTAVAAEHPDFYITSGDDFSVDTLQPPYTEAAVTGRYTLQLPYFDLLARNSPLFLGTGNHEETSLATYNLPPDGNSSSMVAIWAQNARNLYYSVPAPGDLITGNFYSGNTTNLAGIGLLRDYYAWQWGDALFVVIDPYWSSPAQVDTGLGDDKGTNGSKTSNKWLITHGDPQYEWLKQTLEQSTAKWKFVFAHHVMGTGRGGIEEANEYEWGGNNSDGTWGFTTNRPSWALPIHQLMVANHATIFFQGHDHLFAHQQIDGMTYQELPNPADNTYTAFNADAYKTGDIFPNAGYTKVTVGPASVKVQYIREWLPQDQTASQVSGTVQFAYTIGTTKSRRRP
jgi:phosphodiesterase/alkaline phosphatase D-like protein